RLGAPVGRDDAAVAIHTEYPSRDIVETADGVALIASASRRLQPGQYPLTRCQRRAAGRLRCHEDRWRTTGRRIPLRGSGNAAAIRVGAGDLDDGCLWQSRPRAFGAAGQGARSGHGCGYAPVSRCATARVAWLRLSSVIGVSIIRCAKTP